MKTRGFTNNFNSKVKPAAGECCSLKEHYSGVLRELVGYYDKLAARDTTGERFVYAGYEDVREHCKKFNKMGYGASRFWEAMREVRERRIISGQVVRERWVPSGKKGRLVLRKLKGVIVANHDCIAYMVGDECHFVGPMKLCGRWQRTGDAGPGSVLYWNGCGQHATALPQQNSSIAPAAKPNAATSVVVAGVPAAVPSVVPAVEAAGVPIVVSDSAQISGAPEVNPKNRDQAFVTSQPVQPFHPPQPAKPEEPAPPKAAALGLTGEARKNGAAAPNPADVTETIGQRFANYDDEQLLEEISDGEIDVYKLKNPGNVGRHGVATGDVETVAIYARKAIAELEARPWEATHAACARLMDRTIKLMRKDDKEYPPGFLLVLKELQRSGKTCSWKRTPTDDWKKLDPAWEKCRDGIRRREADRLDAGYTVRAADGVWDKA